MFRKSPQEDSPKLEDFPKNFQKQALFLILKTINGIHPVKQSQALLGSNLTRDNQMQRMKNGVIPLIRNGFYEKNADYNGFRGDSNLLILLHHKIILLDQITIY